MIMNYCRLKRSIKKIVTINQTNKSSKIIQTNFKLFVMEKSSVNVIQRY